MICISHNVMKVLLLLLGYIAVASAQTEAWCRCAAFVTYEHSEIMVYESAEVPIDSCQDDAKQCKRECSNELNSISNNGDLWYMQENGETVGQTICTYMADHFLFFIQKHYVYGYFEVCGGAWEYTGVASQDKLCCIGGKHVICA